ncbi:hypothetical protein [Uliginosibacterium gangwonense]|uniref:hypothetical protein n=1 Tax=Uliginosibacterium gangwonense TaxID=392736 RepID=UPI0003643468|nr:hypothetical protein [Uliginosibacterium gangwonense]
MPWMTDLFYDPATTSDPRGTFQNRRLYQMTLPGTHDAGCYVNYLTTNYLARTQSESIFDQLAGGIRYFDIRPCIWHGQFWIYHGPQYLRYYGGRIDGAGGIIDQVAQYIQTLAPSDRELIILNISHFDQFQNADHINLIAAITNSLGNHLVQQTQAAINLFDTNYLTLLTDPAGVASRVAIIYDGALDTNTEAYILANVNALPAGFFVLSPKYAPAANQMQLFDQYANKWFVRDHLRQTGMQTDQLNKLNNRHNFNYTQLAWGAGAGLWAANAPGGVAGTLHLLSWTLTPQTRLDNPIHAARNESNPQLLPFFTTPTHWGGHVYTPNTDQRINIIYVDDYASKLHINPASPWHGMAMPVAIAARMNVGPVGPENTW